MSAFYSTDHNLSAMGDTAQKEASYGDVDHYVGVVEALLKATDKSTPAD